MDLPNPTHPFITVFFPGLGADSTLARYHRLRDSECLWVEWPDPVPSDWEGFVDALIGQIPANRELRYVGISFGGLAALRMAERIPPAHGVFLVGSLVDRSEIRFPYRVALAVSRWLPAFCFDLRFLPRFAIRHAFGIRDPRHLEEFAAMAGRLPNRSVRALCHLLAHWTPGGVRARGRIHGRHDRLLKAGREATLVEGGHLISMTCPEEINAWLQ